MLKILEFLFAPLRDRFYDSLFKKWDKQKEVCQAAISRIEKERNNFEHIVAGRDYNSKDHQRAVEKIAFETLQDSMLKVQKIRKFKKLASIVLAEIENKNAAGVLNAVDVIEPKLKKFVGEEQKL